MEEEVKVMMVEEADMLVWIGARQRGRSSTLQDARPAPTSAQGVQGKRQRERQQGNNKHGHQHRWVAGTDAAAATSAAAAETLTEATKPQTRQHELARQEGSIALSHEPSDLDLSHIGITRYGQMLHLGTPYACYFSSGARRCSIPCTPRMCSFGAGARRCSIPCTPCMCSFGAGARRCPIPCIPCMCS